MYTPFLDNDGSPLSIEQVQYEHLGQLEECEEGHHIEYKLLLENGGKNHIAKVIASFSNCEGGWLFIGIEDGSKKIAPISKSDYSQKIGQIAKRVSPMPEFETRFISTPENVEVGVLIIYVYEGRNAPYICDGSIYVRCGSNKEPIKAADRGNVEYLVERSNFYKKKLDDFFKRDYYFDFGPPQLLEKKYSFICLYLKNISHKENRRLETYSSRRELIDFLKNDIRLFKYAQFTDNSILFMCEYVYPKKGGTIIMELYYDYSCKIYVPVGINDPNEIETAKSFYKRYGIPESSINEFRIYNGSMILNSVKVGLIGFKRFAEKYQLNEADYVLCSEMENIGNTILYFMGEKYQEYLRDSGGMPYAVKNCYKSKYHFLNKYPDLHFSDLASVVVRDVVGPAFGFDSDAICEMLDEDIKRVISKRGMT